jgi:predicted NUDIX family NTP pyrophosphohydrolase
MTRVPPLSAGVILYRRACGGELQVLLVHPGGPYWAKRDDGVWSIPKGEAEGDVDLRATAAREFTEELGSEPPAGPWLDLGEIRQRSGKRVRAWAVEGDLHVEDVTSNRFELEWPPRSGEVRSFPEVDRAAWFPAETALAKLVAAQSELVVRLVEELGGSQRR